MESPFIENIFSNVFVSLLSFPLSETFVISFQSYVSNACVHVGGSHRNTGSQHPLLLLLGRQLLVLADLQYGANIFQFLDGTVHLYC